MNKLVWLSVLALGGVLAMAPGARAQRSAYNAYVYPAGGQQGTTVQIRVGGQRLTGLRDAFGFGTCVTAKLVKYYRRLIHQEVTLVRDLVRELTRAGAQ